jgi:uncharacterized damage-inducible protein DinB
MSTVPPTTPTTSRTPTASRLQTPVTPKQQFLDTYEQEYDRTRRVLRAYPKEKSELRPHPKCKTARELAWMFVMEQGAVEKTLTTGFDWTKPPSFPPPPDSFDAIIGAFEQGHDKIVQIVKDLRDERLYDPIQFYTAPKTIGDIPRLQALWMFLSDQIHHRGQFSIYLRMADAKVPSIYGPSLDEPWM